MRDFANLHDADWMRRQLIAVGSAVGFAAVLAAVGAFASDRYDPFQRIGYWTLIFLFWAVVSRIILRLLPARPAPGEPGRWKILTIATLISLMPTLAVVIWATAAVAEGPTGIEDLVEQIGGIWGLGGAYLFLVDRPFRREPSGIVAEMQAETAYPMSFPRDSKLLERLPGHRPEDIICLAGEDHYVRVHTRQGSALVLMRFNDALEEVADLPGSRVHRSWWVANDAVTALHKEGRVARLELGSSLNVPVSQPYLVHAVKMWSGK